MNEARSEASPFVKTGEEESISGKSESSENKRAEGETFGTTSRTHRLSRTEEAAEWRTTLNTTAQQAGFRREPDRNRSS